MEQQHESKEGNCIQQYLSKKVYYMVITHYDFLRMTEAEQFKAIRNGTFLGDRKQNGIWIQCYSLGSFYVEVFYDSNCNEIKRIRSFSKIEQLSP